MVMLVKGFVNIQSLLSNTPGVVASLGELSTFSQTFSFERGFYQSAAYPDYDLTTFITVDDTGGPIKLVASDVEYILRIVDTMRLFYQGRTGSNVNAEVRTLVYDALPGQLSNLQFGSPVIQGAIALPQWISFSQPVTNHQYHLWFSDGAIRSQYDDYTIKVIAPLTTLDWFFTSTGTITSKLRESSLDVLMNRVEVAKNGYPETYLRVYKFNYIDPVNPDYPIETFWPVLIYGVAGDNLDHIKDTIIDYILANSTHSRTEWEQIFPEIFRRTEFIIIPRWDLIAIPDMLTQTGLYSSVVDPFESIDYATTQIPYYSATHVRNNIRVVPHPYKSISMLIVNGEFNINGKEKFVLVYPDYMPISSTSMDFNRMAVKTQQMVYQLEELLIAAEKMTRYSTLGANLQRVIRSNIMYVSRIIDGVNFIVQSKNGVGVM